MEKLKTLRVWGCFAITEFPKIQANMESLVDLYLGWIGIKVLPSSIGERCTNLTSLTLGNLLYLKSIQLISLDALIHLSKFKCQGNSMLMFHHFPRSLRKLKVVKAIFRDGKFPSYIGELSSLEELDLSENQFERIDFSFSQLTHLKLLILSECKSLVELPKLRSSLAILRADQCESLTSVGDCYTDCKRLCQVSLINGDIVTDGNRLLENMLQGNAIEDQSLLLQLDGLEIPKRFIPGLCCGSRYTLHLPNNWHDDFCGFLMCAVFTTGYRNEAVKMSMKQPMSEEGMDSRQNDVVWEDSMGDISTWVGYISFGLLKHTSWWDRTYNTLSFSIDEDRYKFCSGVGVRLVSGNSRDGRLGETFTDSSDQLSHYKPDFKIEYESAYALRISLGARDS